MRALIVFMVAVQCAGVASGQDAYSWNLPKGFPAPRVPVENPMSVAKAELGRHLFYDKRMSVNGTTSCASCHRQQLAFTDGRAAGIGATGEKHSRGAMSLVNIAYSGALTWNNPELTQLEMQALSPMYGEHPVELGLRKGDKFLPTLRMESTYQRLFAAAFPADADAFTTENVLKAIACFERTIISAGSPYDRYHYERDDSAISDAAKRGETLFFSQPLSCFRCHGGFNFSGDAVTQRSREPRVEFHDTGVGAASGKFKAPTLRNIALTAPYMHDGSITTLDAVLDHYASGGNAHDPHKDPLISGFPLSPQDRKDLIEFLQSLTDHAVLRDERFSDPWPR